MRRKALAGVVLGALCAWVTVSSAQNRIDVVTPSAPELAAFGAHHIGVRTLRVVDDNRPDILNTKPDGPTARYDRALTLEIWYPANLAAGQQPGGEYRVLIRDPKVTATLVGKAVRDATPLRPGAPFPLIIVSHGYPGNRFLMSHLGENLASKGFVVASIDHTDSTYDDQKNFGSTLYNRSLDQVFVLNEIARQSRPPSQSFLLNLADANRTGIVGYSMGGYGVVNTIGGGYSPASATFASAPPNKLLADRGAASAEYRQSIDPRIKAAIAVAPWGMQNGFWDAEGLAGIRTPVLFISGSADDVSGYEKGTRAIYERAINADRYLLTFQHANHNAAAPIPAPAESYVFSEALKSYPFTHYADAVWDTTRMNNILQHFATAFFDVHLKNDQSKRDYLAVAGTTPSWKGFKPKTTVGLTLEHAAPASNAAAQAATTPPVKVTVLSTMLAGNPGEGVGEWGFAALVESNGQRLLVDTGARPETVLKNAAELRIDLSTVTDLVITHNHADHTAGLIVLRRALARNNPKALSRAHVAKGIFTSRLAGNGREANGLLPLKAEYEGLGGTFIEHDAPAQLMPGVWFAGPIPRPHPERNYGIGNARLQLQLPSGIVDDTVPEDSSVVVSTPAGLVVVTGCGHAGIINTLEHARTFTKETRVHAAIGGFHLFGATDDQLAWTAGKLKSFGLQHFLGAHCTGIEAVMRIRQLNDMTRKTAAVGAVGATFTLGTGIDPRQLAQ